MQEYNIIASIKYDKKRIGRFGISSDKSLADAHNQLTAYLNNAILARAYIVDRREYVENLKCYVQCETFKII